MSAEISSVELNIGNHENLPPDEDDAADFLLSNSKYHDCFLTVGNPECEKVERIGVTSLHLIAHSPVFRKMLKNYKQADLPNAKINITDVSPAVFKLMLRYVYGGKLPQMTAIEAAGLALCGDKFKIPCLVQKALKQHDPTSAEDVFPALICVRCIKSPELERKVIRIVQQETDKIVANLNFLELDEDCVIFILKQNTLNISELEVWKSVVRWAEYQVKLNPSKTLRDCLMKIFGYVRFLTLPLEEIAEHVLPTKIITTDEYVDLSLTITKIQMLESPLLCKIQEKRGLYKEEDVIAIPANVDAEMNTKNDTSLLKQTPVLKDKPGTELGEVCIFKTSDYYNLSESLYLTESTISIKPGVPIEIVSFTCRSVDGHCRRCGGCRSSGVCKERWNADVTCNITVTKTLNITVYDMTKVVVVGEEEISVQNKVRRGEHVILPIKLKNGQPLVLKPEETCTITLKFNQHLFAHNLSTSNGSEYALYSTLPLHKDNVTFTDNESPIFQIHYKTV